MPAEAPRLFFTADTHFGHGGARGLYRRPFASVAAMDAAMLERWNATVAPQDDIWHLGDVALGPKPAALAALLARLHGRKHLVTGNNDGPEIRAWPGWASVQDYAEITVEGRGLVLCHYPFRSWRNMGRGWINLHGHSHGRLQPLPRQCDVGVDAWDFRPVTLAEILGRRGRPARPQPEGHAG
ncbi:metallophosphoesterase family protein [Pseudoroseomonas cervicalis]|uniref:metallophosphoesterase family protein n=1 Tax=Teichococcus cervicalis TaxID=204525 RepID=UPI0022F18146|nr:metallophosphoesterase family protein [Pseudoroseomonas cervicalis]WBV43394.1 metallophosphoesterase family protein [Pseudoroseomonas cervicalis]